MDSKFMEVITTRVASRGVTVARFEFAYMAMRRQGAARRPPPKIEALVGEYRAAVTAIKQRYPDAHLFIGGKSMGGRVASMIAGDLFGAGEVLGCVCLGYPFHPTKRPEQLRTEHLTSLRCPTLIVQGERDALGNRREVDRLALSGAIEFAWVGDGDHDLYPRTASGLTHDANLNRAADQVADFIERRSQAC